MGEVRFFIKESFQPERFGFKHLMDGHYIRRKDYYDQDAIILFNSGEVAFDIITRNPAELAGAIKDLILQEQVIVKGGVKI